MAAWAGGRHRRGMMGAGGYGISLHSLFGMLNWQGAGIGVIMSAFYLSPALAACLQCVHDSLFHYIFVNL